MNHTVFLPRAAGWLALLLGLSCPNVIRTEQPPDLRKQLTDPSAAVRKQAALTLAEANDAEAIPVLIDLLAELPAEQRRPVEEFLTKLAGEWAPVGQLASEDRIARKICRDAWIAWWRNTDGPALLAVIRDHTLTPELRQKIKERIHKLGADDLSIREAAANELFNLGRITLPQLREASRDRDLELARRVHDLIDRLERQPSRTLPAAAVRLLALRKPQGASEVLLAYVPLAEEDNLTDEVRKSLALLALRGDKIDGTLVRALADDLPLIRAVAAEALVQGGGPRGRQAARKLLHDDAATVRLRTALALALAQDKDAVPELIDLLAVLPEEQIGQAESVLYQLAGDTPPEVPAGREPDDKKKCRDAWANWWKTNAFRVEMTRLTEDLTLGFTIVCNIGGGSVYEIDRRGKLRWRIDHLNTPVDAIVVHGNRVLIAEYNGGQVSERDLKGNIIWKRNIPIALSVQRLPNGNTFLAGQNQLLELDRDGKEIYSIPNPVINGAYRSRQGPIVCLTRNNQCVLMDTKGKTLKSFAVNFGGNNFCVLDVPANDRILVLRREQNKVVEFDQTGKLLREVDVRAAATVTGLLNGRLLVASQVQGRIYELDRAGKVVWEHNNAGPVFRARRR